MTNGALVVTLFVTIQKEKLQAKPYIEELTLYKNKTFALSIAYAQLAFSALLAVTIIIVYVEFRATLGQFSQSLAATIVSMANVIGQTAETVQTKQSLFDNALATLVSSRKAIEELRVSAQNQISSAPRYAEGLHETAEILASTGNVFFRLGDSMMFSMPTSIQLDGIKPVWVMSKPLEKQGLSLKADAQTLKSLGSGLQAVSTTLSTDGKNLGKALANTSNDAIKLLNETEKTLISLKNQNLPQAIAELKSASENMHSASRQVNSSGNLGLVLLVAGLMLSGWCFLNSLSVLYLTRNQSI